MATTNGQNGKGSKPRPFSVPADEYAKRWDAIDWGKKDNNERPKPNKD